VQLYGSLGYEISSSGEVHEVGFQKVALYTRQSIPTHVSIQLKNGVWSSKLGVVEDLSHPSLETLSTFFNTFPQYRDLYGQVELIMAKPLSD
jgi:hypothetical protein